MQRNTILNRQWEEYILLFSATVRVLKIVFDQKSLAHFIMGGLKMVGLYSGGH